jgi:hypothetical protein
VLALHPLPEPLGSCTKEEEDRVVGSWLLLVYVPNKAINQRYNNFKLRAWQRHDCARTSRKGEEMPRQVLENTLLCFVEYVGDGLYAPIAVQN